VDEVVLSSRLILVDRPTNYGCIYRELNCRLIGS
jgi:hypothetical protein